MAFLAPIAAALVVVLVALQSEAQQSYVNNKQLDCNQSPNTTLGFVCNAAPSCPSFLTFRSTPIYNSPATIAYLLSSDASLIASANNISDVAPLPVDTLLIVPVNCSCSGDGRFYQHNATYSLKVQGETYFSVANNTYQSLSTCQALIAQNPYDARQLLAGMRLAVPLRCACPTPAQSAAGFRYLLTYLLRQGNDVGSVAAEFAAAGADVPGILAANNISEGSSIFYFTPLLVPLKTQPSTANTDTSVPPPPPLSPPALPAASAGGSHKWVFVGVGIGVAVFVILSSIALVWFFRRRSRHPPPPILPPQPPPLAKGSELSEGIRIAMESLTVYTVEELEKATNSFSESMRMDGSSSVYLGWFNGDAAAVKVVKGDVSREIDALRQMKHSRIVSLSGFCLHQGTTYLVYEYAEGGSLHQRLHRPSASSKAGWLDWKQRVQIAYDVADALNYLHNFTSPPYIHKNLTTTNILLDAAVRAKVANFGLARTTSSDAMTTRHVVGAQGYMAPEYIEAGLLTPKLDVFALGVVVLELLSGREAVDLDHDPVLLYQSIGVGGGVLSAREKLQGFMDPKLGEEYPLELAYSMAQLAAACVALDPKDRPSVSEVFVALSSLRSSSLDWDPSQDTSITFSE